MRMALVICCILWRGEGWGAGLGMWIFKGLKEKKTKKKTHIPLLFLRDSRHGGIATTHLINLELTCTVCGILYQGLFIKANVTSKEET